MFENWLSFLARDVISTFLVIVFESIDSSEGKNRVFVVSSPSCFLIAQAKHLIQVVDPPFLDSILGLFKM